MADFKSRLTLDGSDFSKTMDQAGRSVNEFTKQTDSASKSVNEIGQQTTRTASELLKEMKNMNNAGRATSNYRQQLSQMTRQLQDLTVNYRMMSDEMKNSDFGKEVAAQIDTLKKKAAEYKDAITDAQHNVKLLSSDTANLDAAKQGITAITGAMQVFAGMGMLGEKNTEKLVKMMAKLKAIESATNGVLRVANALNKDSILMLKLKDLWTKLHTKSVVAQTTATEGATVAQKAFNTAAKKNVYVILATVILAAAAAIYKFAKANEEAKKAQEEQKKETERQAQLFEDYKSKVGGAIGDVLSKFEKLRIQWNTLKTEQEKTEWIEKNKEAFKELGLKVEDVNTAQRVLVDQADDVIKALRAQADALAVLDLAAEKSKEIVAEQMDMQKDLAQAKKIQIGSFFTAGGLKNTMPQSWQDAPYFQEWAKGQKDLFEWGGGQSGAGTWTITQEQAEDYFAYVEEQHQKRINQIRDEQDAITKMYEKSLKDAEDANETINDIRTDPGSGNGSGKGSGGSGGSGGTHKEKVVVEPELAPDSLAYWQKQVKDIQDVLNNTSIDDAGFNNLVSLLNIAKGKVKEIQDLMKEPPEQIQLIPPQTGITLAQAQKEVSKLQELLKNTDPGDVTRYYAIAGALGLWTKEVERLQGAFDKITGKAKETEEKAKDTEVTMHDWYSAANNLIGAFGNINSGISSIYDTWANISEDLEDKNPFEKILYSIDAVLSTLSKVVSIMDTINGLSEFWNILTGIGVQLKKKENAEEVKGAAIEGAKTATKSTNTGIDILGAIAKVIQSASEIPMVGWVIGLAAAAAVIGIIAAAKSSSHFAQGGIVPGTSFSGDKVSAQLNSGEMVLNTGQQRRLFDMLDGKGTAGGGKVEFVIKGQELRGVLNNYNKKQEFL